MAKGRPTEYNEIKTPQEVGKYVTLCQKNNYLPTIAGLAVHLSVSRECLYEWGRVHPEFSDILEQLKAAQESQLIQNGLAGVYNSTITKLMLTKHGYSDKQETDITSGGKEIAPVLVKFIDGKDNQDTEGV